MAQENGPLDQQAEAWRTGMRANVSPRNPVPLSYAVWNGRRVDGYLRHAATRDDRTLRVLSLISNTPEAGRRLLTFLADHRSTIETVVWHGSPNDPLLLLLPEHSYRARLASPWMLRVVDVPRALRERGYPAEVSARVHLRVQDDLFPGNRGPFVLEVEDGRGAVRRGGRGSVRCDVRGLAPLYSGHLSASQLAMTGYLEATPEEIGALQAIFAGPLPWMPDAF